MLDEAPLPSWGRRAAGLVLRGLGWRNYLYMLRRARLQYGIHQYSRVLCSERVSFHLPMPCPATRIVFDHRIPWAAARVGQSAQVVLNGVPAGCHPCRDDALTQSIEVPLNDAARAAGCVALDVEFSQSVRIRPLRNALRPQRVAAVVEGVRLE